MFGSSRFSLFLGLALSLGPVAGARAEMPAPPVNLLKNGSFETADENGFAIGWHATGPLLGKRLDSQDRKEGRFSQFLSGRGGRALMVWQDVPVEPNTDYDFSIWVKSDDRVEVRLVRQRMAYNRQADGPEERR